MLFRKKKAVLPDNRSFLAIKQELFETYDEKQKKLWYFDTYEKYRLKLKIKKSIKFLVNLKIKNKYLSFARWILVDFLRDKNKKFFGIYMFVGLPGQGKTLSMVAHVQRVRSKYKDVFIASNFGYKHEEAVINHWTDIVRVAEYCRIKKRKCVIMMDEIHTTFDSSDWKNFPPELLSLLSFYRKYRLQFLCSSQIYDRIPKKIRDIGNYVVICKNVLGADRLFYNYYFEKSDYDTTFSGKKKKAKFIKTYVAGDDLYGLYNTLSKVKKLTNGAKAEIDARKNAFRVLFGQGEEANE